MRSSIHARRPKLMCLAGVVIACVAAFVTSASAAVVNPDLQAACGTKVVIVLDESASVDATAGAETAVRSAASAFATGLVDTGSQLAVIEFGSAAKRVLGYTDVTSGAAGTLATTFQPYFSGTAIPPADVYNSPSQTGAWTNWQDALEEVKLLNASSGVAPLVVFITDGDPTAINIPGGVQVRVATATALASAIAEADAIKAQGSHILALGVGAALANLASFSRLVAISGSDTVTTAAAVDLTTTDVLAVADFANLPPALPTLVNELCQSSVTITKLVDDGQGPVAGGAGWRFDAAVTTGGGYTWLAPDPGAAGPRGATTGADSTVTLQWKPAGASTSTIAVTETERQGYRLSAVSCRVASPSAPTPVPLPVVVTGATFVATLGPTDVVTCTVTNVKLPTIVTVTPPPVVSPPVDVAGGGSTTGTPQTTLGIDKRGPATARAGQVVTYRIKITNTGAVAAQDVIMRDRVPGGMALAARPTGVRLVKGVVIVAVGTLTPGASRTVLLRFRIDRPVVGVRTNVATASGSNAREVRASTRTRIISLTGRIRIPVVTG